MKTGRTMVGDVTIFVVEEEADLREFLESLLGAEHGVRVFATGKSALDALREATPPPAVLLSDLDLRDMTGEEIAHEAARIQGRTRVILMSVNHRRLERARPLASTVIHKPFSIEELTGALAASLEA